MRILVTGGAGFIGSHVVALLVSAGHQVAVVDSLVSGKRENLVPEVEFHQVDIREPELTEILRQFQPEVVSHHAAQVSVPVSMEDPLLDAGVNVLGSLNLLEACRRFGVRKVIFASSVAAYGEPLRLPVDEEHGIKPLSPYGLSKYTFEQYLRLYQANYGLDYTVFRYANVYGPRQDAHGEAGVVAIFTTRMLRGEGVLVYGSGEQTRDFIYAGDVATATLAALERGPGAVCNLGTGVQTSVNELWHLLAKQIGYGGQATHAPAREGEIFRISLDSHRATELLGWQPQVPLAEGLKRTVEAFAGR